MRATCAGAVIVALGGAVAAASEPKGPGQGATAARSEYGTYCGVYGVHRALLAVGVRVPSSSLVQRRYIGSRQGSTANELLDAARDSGAFAEAASHMTCRMLSYVDCPAVLHVKSSLGLTDYDHWFLFLGLDGGKARIADGQKPLSLMSLDELAARWDGTALLIDAKPIQRTRFLVATASDLTWCVGLIVCLLAFGLYVRDALARAFARVAERNAGPHFAVEATILIGLALLAAVLCRAWDQCHFLSDRDAITALQEAHLGGFLPKVGARQVDRAIREGRMMPVDARIPTDFREGHLPNAINVPAFAGAEGAAQRMAKIPKEARLVVYAQSSGCTYADTVARNLLSIGYRDVAIFRGGWVAWQEYQAGRAR